MKKVLVMVMMMGLGFGAGAAVKSGEAAPDFTAASTKGEVKLADYKGKWLVLYFYPKADTPGCTKESCSLRDGYEQIQKAGAEILGVSLDTVEDQQKFKDKYKLPFPLLADTDKKVTKAYDVLNITGKFASRYTFLIAPDGKIAHVFDKVDTGAHNSQVLAELERLKAAQK